MVMETINRALSFDMKKACNENSFKVDSESSVNFTKCPLPIVRCPTFLKQMGHLPHFAQFLE